MKEKMAAFAASATSKSQRARAILFLRAVLQIGPRSQTEVEREAKRTGLSERTLRRAKMAIGVIAQKVSFQGGWNWQLPQTEPGKLAAFGDDKDSRVESIRLITARERGTNELRDSAEADVQTCFACQGSGECGCFLCSTHDYAALRILPGKCCACCGTGKLVWRVN